MRALCLNNCLRESVWVYQLKEPINRDLINKLRTSYSLQFPMGEELPFFKVEDPRFILTGNIGRAEIKVTFKIQSPDVRVSIERLLTEFEGASIGRQ